MSDFDAQSARTRQPLPLWLTAFDRATKEHTPEIIGAYMLILMAMWEAKSCDLPNDEKHLAWVAKVTPTVWRRKFAPIIMPMLAEKNSRIFSEKLKENAEKTEEYCRKQHERKLEKNKPKPLKGNKTRQTADTSTEQSTDAPTVQPIELTINISKIDDDDDSAGARDLCPDQSEPLTFREKILAALGLDTSGMTGRGGTRLGTQADMFESRRWFSELKLTQDEVFGVLADTMASRNGVPPNSFRYLTKCMETFALAAIEAEANPLMPAPQYRNGHDTNPPPLTAEKLLEMMSKREAELEANRGQN